MGSCAWRCDSGFRLDDSNANVSMHRCTAFVQEELPPPLAPDEAAPAVSVQMQLPMTQAQFTSLQDDFIKAMARAAGVHPQDVRVVSVTEVVQERRRVSLVVVTELRSRNVKAVEQALTLTTVNAALSEAGLPPAATMKKETKPAAAASAGAKNALAESHSQQSSSIDMRIVLLAVTAGVGVLLIGVFAAWLFRKKRDAGRVFECENCEGSYQTSSRQTTSSASSESSGRVGPGRKLSSHRCGEILRYMHVYTCVHACMHACIHAYMHTHTSVHIHACKNACTHKRNGM